MEFLTGLIIGISIGFVWGVWRATQSFIERIINQPEEIRELMARVNQTVKEETVQEVTYRTEWHNDVCYLYDSKDNFLAQGDSVTEAMNRAEQRFPGLKLNFRVNDVNESNQ